MATVSVTVRRGGVRGVVDPVAELTAVGEALEELPKTLLDAASPVARQAILDSVAANRGGSLTLSGMGATLDVAPQTIVAAGSAASVKLTAIPAGPWAIVEYGTGRHDIVSRRGMPTGKVSRRNPRGVFSAVSHPGSAGRAVWQSGCTAADGAVDTAVEAAAEEVLP